MISPRSTTLPNDHYLLFLGWCILGVKGRLFLESREVLDLDGDLGDQEIYSYIIDEGDALQAVDLEVIRTRASVPLETMQTHENFHNKLLEPGVQSCLCGSDWLWLIVENCPHNNENVEDLDDINDIHNGVFAFAALHTGFDAQHTVVLRTPNQYFQPEDIPPHNNCHLSNNLKPDKTVQHTRKPKPSELLLHYNYGATAVKWWGHGIQVLDKKFKPPCPPKLAPALSRPSKSIHNRTTACDKLEAAWERNTTGKHRTASKLTTRKHGTVQATAEVTWDEDIMLLLWGNSCTATECHSKKVQENVQHMEQWRKGLSYV
ncbi:hypothetical protein BYT27DRAFT_7224680 [Phlegmacium glaucopus]|nr:hypothetical protein BYT27DRAFT_7224680 [Phlegmacium glaucopus]